jgi:hypothetical protein
MKCINLISSPRNISTAMMYSFAQRPDTQVLDEPFYAHYLLASQADHPAKEDVIRDQPARVEDVLRQIYEITTPVVFIKNMSHHLEVMDEAFLENVENIFFIRNPHQVIASYAQVIEKPVMRDIGMEYQYHLFMRLMSKGQNPVVLDSGLLLQNPESVLTQLCERVGIPFYKAMLQWPAGPKTYDGVWAPYWYANVHRSTGFEKQVTSSRALAPELRDLYHHANFFYEKLLPFSLKP